MVESAIVAAYRKRFALEEGAEACTTVAELHQLDDRLFGPRAAEAHRAIDHLVVAARSSVPTCINFVHDELDCRTAASTRSLPVEDWCATCRAAAGVA